MDGPKIKVVRVAFQNQEHAAFLMETSAQSGETASIVLGIGPDFETAKINAIDFALSLKYAIMHTYEERIKLVK